MAAEGAEQSAAVAAGAAAPKLYSKSQTGWMLFVLAALLANSFSDRAILAILAQPIMTELRITDTQFGVLTGLAFATFYAIFGYPIAHLAGRFGRINIITICALLWSAMAAGCGMALNYFQLALFRFGVGIGESGMAAPGQAIISDYVPPERRTSSIALFQMGPPLGVMAGSVAGGWLAQHFGWRTAFVIVALPGFLLAPLLKLTVREPPQGNWDASRLAGGAPKAAPSLLRVLAKLYSTSTMRHMTAGTVIAIFANSGAAFLGAYYVRRFGLDYTTLGLIIGIMGGVAGVTGVLMGGFLTDWFAKWSKRWYALLPTFALLAAAPLFVLAYLQADWRIQSAIMMVSSALLAIAPIPFYGVTQNLVPGPMRAPAAAIGFFLINLVSLGFGPVFYGMLIDATSANIFAGYQLGDYAALCGPTHTQIAGAEAARACKAALAEGTRWSLAGGFVGFFWAAAHFFLASRTITAHLAEAQQTN